jgi:predicted PurR-regulated permease PerM
MSTIPDPTRTLDRPPAAAPAGGGPGIDRGATIFARRLNVVAMSVLLIVLTLHLAREFATILQQLLIAGFLAYLILPIHRRLVRNRVAPWLSALLLIVVFMSASYGLGQMIYTSIADLATGIPKYQRTLSNLIQRAADRIPGVNKQVLQQIIVGQNASVESTVEVIRSALGSFFTFLTQLTLVLVYLAFLMAEQVSLRGRIATAFDPEQSSRILTVIAKINDSIVEYIAVKTLMSLLTMVLTVVVLVLFGVKFAMLWGIVAFLFNYIPYVGSLVATLLPVMLSLVDSESPLRALVLLIVLTVVQNSIGYVVEPRFAGRRLDLSPLIIILALAFGGTVWGVCGMILAIPLTVAIKAVLENIDQTRPFAALMSNT